MCKLYKSQYIFQTKTYAVLSSCLCTKAAFHYFYMPLTHLNQSENIIFCSLLDFELFVLSFHVLHIMYKMSLGSN